MKKSNLLIFLVFLAFNFVSCKRGPKSKTVTSDQKQESNKSADDKIETIPFNIFIECSGSMDGYVSQRTSNLRNKLYKINDAIGNLDNKGVNVPLNYHFISGQNSQKAFAFNNINSATTYISNLSGSKFKSLTARSSSFIPEIIESSIMKSKDDISILVTDLIFSPNSETPDLKAGESKMQNTLKRIRKSLSQERGDLSALIIRSVSEFEGKYYIESTPEFDYKPLNRKRPFYILAFGPKKKLDLFMKELRWDAFEQSNLFYMADYNMDGDVKMQVAPPNYKKGTYTYSPSNTNISFEKEGVDGNSFAVQLFLENNSSLPDAYFNDKSNYKLSNSKWKVTDVTNEGKRRVIVTTNDFSTRPEDFTIGLSNSYLPNWVDKFSNDDDSNPKDSIQQTQTYGAKEMINGIMEGMSVNVKNEYMFSKDISFGLSGKGGMWWLIIPLLLIALGFVLFFKAKRKHNN